MGKVLKLKYFCVYNTIEIIIYIYRRYTSRVFHVFFLHFAVIPSEPHEKPRRENLLTEKVHKPIWDITFWLHALFYKSFFVAFSPWFYVGKKLFLLKKIRKGGHGGLNVEYSRVNSFYMEKRFFVLFLQMYVEM